MSPQKRQLLAVQFVAVILAAFAAFPIGYAQSPGSHAHATSGTSLIISGQIIGASRKHVIFVALWDSGGFLKRPVQQITIEPGADPHFQFRIPAGRWALSAFEDENGNGILDMGVFGPREPSGFWRPFHAWRKPRFDDVAAQIDRDTIDADIQLNR
jgi:uncharacterized protein (DUF2141 family)